MSQDTIAAFRLALLTDLPELRAFAISLCGDRERAADLVQETLLKAWGQRATFIEGSHMKPWLFRILRNTFYSQMRRAWREVLDSDGEYAAKLVSPPEQHSKLDFDDLNEALMQLPAEQREALILVFSAGLSYEDAAACCDCPIGTIRSRINRGRQKLAKLMEVSSPDDFGCALTNHLANRVFSGIS